MGRMVMRGALACVALVLVYQFYWGAPAVGALSGRTAPNFRLPFLAGGHTELTAHRGKVVWVTFWTTWCGVCKRVLPSINALQQIYWNRGVEVLAIDVEEDPATVAAYVQQHKLTVPVVLDHAGSVARLYDVPGFPTSLLIDKQGKVADTFVGGDNYASPRYLDRIHELLAE